MPITVASIYRYPVKGLSAEPLARVALTPGACLPHDRRFALARAGTRIDPAHPVWLAKSNFFMLMRDEILAQLHTRFDEASGMFTAARDGKELLRADITDAAGRAAIDAFFAEFLGEVPGHPPRVVEAPGHAFADAKRKPNATSGQYVSFVNLASVEALEQAAQAPVDPLRFRANVYLTGLPAWAELKWVGAEIRAGEAHLRVISPITRCAATNVNPGTALRDLDLPALLRKEFGHNHMGVYAEVTAHGQMSRGDALVPC